MCVATPQAKKPDTPPSSSPTPAMSSVLSVSDITKGSTGKVAGMTYDQITVFQRMAAAGGAFGKLAADKLTQQGISTSPPNSSGALSAIDSVPDPAAVFAPRILGAPIGPAQLKIPTP